MEKTCVHKDIPLITHFTRRCHKFTLAPFIVLNSGWEDKRGQVDEKEKSMDLFIKDARFFPTIFMSENSIWTAKCAIPT